MTDFRLVRTGDSALVFSGEQIVKVSSQRRLNGGALQNRWHEIAAYRTAGGKCLAAVTFRSCWQGEHDHHAAQIFDTPRELVDWLKLDYNPRDHWQGYPAGEHYAERQSRIEAEIRAGYLRAVSEVLSQLPETDERIE